MIQNRMMGVLMLLLLLLGKWQREDGKGFWEMDLGEIKGNEDLLGILGFWRSGAEEEKMLGV